MKGNGACSLNFPPYLLFRRCMCLFALSSSVVFMHVFLNESLGLKIELTLQIVKKKKAN